MVLFTALFAIGMAPKARGFGLGSVFALAGAGLSVLAGSADRPEVLLVLALALGAAAMTEAVRRHWAFALLALVRDGLAPPDVVRRVLPARMRSASRRRGSWARCCS